VAVRRLGLSAADLRRAAVHVADALGSGVVFTLLNLGAAVAVVLALRALTGRFFSLYALDDLAWLAVSLLQGWIWRLWRDAARAGRPRAAS
jgi:hypothetical protein